MRLAQLDVVVTLTQINCGKCGGTYAINERLRSHKEEHGTGWHCPYCQTGWGYFKSDAEKERERHQQTLARLNEAEAERDRINRQLKRVKRGVCPQCNRTFLNLQRHMECKHGDKK